jgi:hypothetical protein
VSLAEVVVGQVRAPILHTLLRRGLLVHSLDDPGVVGAKLPESRDLALNAVRSKGTALGYSIGKRLGLILGLDLGEVLGTKLVLAGNTAKHTISQKATSIGLAGILGLDQLVVLVAKAERPGNTALNAVRKETARRRHD